MATKEELLERGKATQFQSGNEAAENGKKGGRASGPARRKKNAARKWLSEIMAYKPALTPRNRAVIEQVGGNPDEQEYTTEGLIMVALAQKCMKGDTRAIQLYLEMFGEDPKTVIEKERLKVQKEAVQALKNNDGFMDAMNGFAGEVFASGFDTPDNLGDTE